MPYASRAGNRNSERPRTLSTTCNAGCGSNADATSHPRARLQIEVALTVAHLLRCALALLTRFIAARNGRTGQQLLQFVACQPRGY